MRKLLPAVLSGVALSFSSFAFSQSVGADVRAPAQAGADVSIDNNQQGGQNSATVGNGNQTLQQGSDSQANQTMGSGNTSSNTQSDKSYSSGDSSASAGASRDEDKDKDKDKDKHESKGTYPRDENRIPANRDK